MGQISLQQVADQLRISRATVSKVINDQPGVALETRKKILRFLEKNGYKKFNRDLLEILQDTKGVAAKPSSIQWNIAVVVTEPHFSTFWIEIINGIASYLDQNSCHLIYHFLARDEEKQHKIPSQLKNSNLDGLIVLNIYDIETTKKLEALGLSTVFLDGCPELAQQPLKGDMVLLEGYKCLYNITRMLLKQGCKRLGFIGDIDYSQSIQHRWLGFQAALRDDNTLLQPEYCLLHNQENHYYERKAVFSALEKIERQPQAWVCANDHIAFIVVEFLREKGLNIPSDIAVSGFDNIVNTLQKPLNLTTAHVDVRFLGQRLARQLLMRLDSPQMPFEVIHIEPEIRYGKSTLPPVK